MQHNTERKAALAASVMALALSGCSQYVTHKDYDPAIAELHATDQRMQGQIDGLSQKYDALATRVAGMVRVDDGAHFATGDATLGEEDKPFLADFAHAVASQHPQALVTVEGFADPQGGTRMNQDLGQRRAEAVQEFLVSNGLPANQVRAVSYGEAENRQVRPGAIGPDGADNRRASLVIDFDGGQSTPSGDAPATN